MTKKRKINDLNATLVSRNDTLNVRSADVTVAVKDICDIVVREITGSDTVAGIVAWVTHPKVIDALLRCQHVTLIVNEETWLTRAKQGWIKNLQKKYAKLKGRGVVYFKTQKNVPQRNRPRCHSKFLVFYDKTGKPDTVLTGSFNLTVNSTRSIENVVLIRDKRIAQFYHDEIATVLKHLMSPQDRTPNARAS